MQIRSKLRKGTFIILVTGISKNQLEQCTFKTMLTKANHQNTAENDSQGAGKRALLLIVATLSLSYIFLIVSSSYESQWKRSYTKDERHVAPSSELQDALAQSSEKWSGLPNCGSDTRLAQVPFEVLRSDVLNNLHDEGCKQRHQECLVYNSRLLELEKMLRLQTNAKPRLFVMNLDPLAWKYSTEEQLAIPKKDIENVIQYVKSRRAFINWRASDHVFLCLSSNCSAIISTFAEKLSNGEGTRAILVMKDPNQEVLKWPCPLRIINADHYSKVEGQFWKELFQDLAKLIDRETRWRCSDDLHPVQHWQNASDNVRRHGLLDSRNDYLFCTIPKCGSTAIRMFVRRSMGMRDYADMSLPHNANKNGLVAIHSMRDPKLTKEVFSDERIITGMFVRNPAARLVSAYLDKIVFAKEYRKVNGLNRFKGTGHTPTFSEVVNTLIQNHPDPSKAEIHFKSLASYCGSVTTAYDFVGDLDNFHEEFVEFAESIGLWRKYGEYGWGEFRNESFVDAWLYEKERHDSTKQLWEYYDEDLLRKVYNYYKNDFIQFRYSIDEMIAQMPKEQRQ